ncbi:DNA-binding CsgD family transcriptional regulator [Conyzicola nivalis]|uniref:DNA-binding CsgD family transcriptional regulator n=1 Tax=Conyzicola nivalis TaxID=1477021 RepID=A0ABV2QU80_9MICO
MNNISATAGRVQGLDRKTLVGSDRFRFPLRGRSAEAEVIAAAISDVDSGESRIVLLRGVAGSGKTRLLGEILTSTSRSGWRAVVAVPDPESHLVPTAVLIDAALAAEPPLLTAADVAALATSPDSRYWFIQMYRNAVEAAAQENSFVFIVDDLQWADAASIAILRSLVSSMGDLPILWAFAARTGEHDENVRAALSEWATEGSVIEIESLSDDATVDMATDLLGGVPDAGLEATLRRAENLPLLVSELVQGLVEENLVTVDDDVAAVRDAQIPERFGASIRERIVRLPRRAGHLVQVASILGRNFSVSNLAELLGESTSELIDGIDLAIQADILVNGSPLKFRHDAIRETAELMLRPAIRTHLRRRAADIRLRSGEPLLAVAASVADSAERGDTAAVDLLHDAALQLAPVDATGAAGLANRAVELASSPDQYGLIADLIPVLWVGGRVDAAKTLAHGLKTVLSPADRARTQLAIARLETESSFAAAIATADEALAMDGVPLGVRAQLLAVKTLNLANIGDYTRLGESVVEARVAAQIAGDVAALATVDATESVLRFYEHRWADASRLIGTAVASMSRLPGFEAAQWLPEGLWPAFLANAAGEGREALRITEGRIEETQRTRSAIALAFWTMVKCRTLFDLGDLEEARAQAETVMTMAADLDLGDFAQATAGVVLYRVALLEGDYAACQAQSGKVRAMADSAALRLTGSWLLALTADADGDTESVMTWTAGAYETLEVPTPSLMTPADTADDALLARMWHKAGATERLERLAAVSRFRAETNPENALVKGIDAHIRALLSDSVDEMRVAVELLRTTERPLALALALEDLGLAEMKAETGGQEQSWNEAADILEKHGAVRDANRVLRHLRGLGVRRRAKASEQHSGMLSARELQVAERLASGSTTKQIASDLSLSQHTVLSHVRHIYEKWGISTRRALVERVARRAG